MTEEELSHRHCRLLSNAQRRGGQRGHNDILLYLLLGLLTVLWISTTTVSYAFVLPTTPMSRPQPSTSTSISISTRPGIVRGTFFLSSLSSSRNPNDYESEEEREERMKLVRQIQSSFYAGEGEDFVQPLMKKEDGRDIDPTILTNVPLWRVQWTELPGYQNILNVHVAHYTHMFRRILSGSKPWYFGHIYLPGGSENLDNPIYRLPTTSSTSASVGSTNSEDNDNSNSSSRQPTTDATLVGTLMQISDYKYMEDGRLALIVQAMERFHVIEATQHVPYAIATIQRDPDLESVLLQNNNNNKKKKKMSDSSSVDDDDNGNKNNNNKAIWDAIQQSIEWSDWEFRPTLWNEILPPSTTTTTTTEETTSSSSKKTNNARMMLAAATPLINYNSGYFPNELINNRYGGRKNSDQLSNASLMEQLRLERILQTLEYKVWCSVDIMLQLLIQLDPTLQIPVPSQLLGLLPILDDEDDEDDDDGSSTTSTQKWPVGFRLEDYANQLQKNNAIIGTTSKSPFVRISENPSYPLSRRASRLSYTIWVLLESIVIQGGPTKQDILEESSIQVRLEMAITALDIVNNVLRKSLPNK